MKLGSAKKWIEILESGKYRCYNGMHIHRDSYNDTQIYHSALGVLADFLDPDAWQGWNETGMYDKWNGGTFDLPKQFTKSAKMKTTDASFVPHSDDNYGQILRDHDWNGGKVSIADVNNYAGLAEQVNDYNNQIVYINRYYEQM